MSGIRTLPKLCGGDIELCNFVLGMPGPEGCRAAARVLLAGIDGVPESGARSFAPQAPRRPSRQCGQSPDDGEDSEAPAFWSSREEGRKFLPSNGGSVYIDLDHLEICLPEVRSAWEHAAAFHAMLRPVRDAMEFANARLPADRAIQVLVNNSDGHGHSYGSHLNFLVTQQAWDNAIRRKPHYLGWLASFQVSSIVCTGQGKVGAENRAPEVPYQISQRADYFETLVGPQTTYERPIVNSREEHLCGGSRSRDAASPARLHVIFFDNTLAHRSCLLKVGMMQLALAMMEAECVNPALVLDDPLAAVGLYSRDPTLNSRAPLAAGGEVTAVDLQLLFLAEAKRFAASGGFDRIVPQAAELLELWEDTLRRLESADWIGLASRLDWVMKLMSLQRAMAARKSLAWDSPEIRHLDHVYSALDAGGLYWSHERSGFAERLIEEDRIRHFCTEPPADTRAWTRAMLLRRADPAWIDRIDWDSIAFRVRDGGYWPQHRVLAMDNPLAMTAGETAPLFESQMTFTELLDALESRAGAEPRTPPAVN